MFANAELLARRRGDPPPNRMTSNCIAWLDRIRASRHKRLCHFDSGDPCHFPLAAVWIPRDLLVCRCSERYPELISSCHEA